MNTFQKSYAFQIETDLCSHKRLTSCTWDHVFHCYKDSHSEAQSLNIRVGLGFHFLYPRVGLEFQDIEILGDTLKLFQGYWVKATRYFCL